MVQSKPIDIFIQVGNWFCWQFLAFTTALFIYPMAKSSLLQHTTEDGARFWAVATCIIFYFIIDAGLSKMLEWQFKVERPKTVLSDKDKAAGKYISLVTLLIVVKLMATMTSSLWAAPEISDNLTNNDGEITVIAEASQKDSDHRAAQKEAFQLYTTLLATQDERVKKAVANGDYWQRKSYEKQGFAWLLNRKNNDPSDKAYALSIKAEMEKADKAYQHLLSFSKDSSHTVILSALARKAEREAQLYQERKERRTGYIWAFDILATILGLFFTYLKALREKAGAVVMKRKNVSAIFAAFFTNVYDAFMDWLEKFLGVDLDGNGSIGGQRIMADVSNIVPLKRHETNPLSVAETENETAVKQPQTIGFKMPETSVKQPFRAKQPTEPKQPKQPIETVETANTEERYWRQRLKQSYRRKLSQSDPTTPAKQFNIYKEKLQGIGYIIEETKDGLKIIPPDN